MRFPFQSFILGFVALMVGCSAYQQLRLARRHGDEQVAALHSEADYAALQISFGVRRTDSDFWSISDQRLGCSRSGRTRVLLFE